MHLQYFQNTTRISLFFIFSSISPRYSHQILGPVCSLVCLFNRQSDHYSIYLFSPQTFLVVPYFPKITTQVPMMTCKALYDLDHDVVANIIYYQNYASLPLDTVSQQLGYQRPKSEPLQWLSYLTWHVLFLIYLLVSVPELHHSNGTFSVRSPIAID